jgi:hypothetical protein
LDERPDSQRSASRRAKQSSAAPPGCCSFS